MRRPRRSADTTISIPYSQSPVASWRDPKPLPLIVSQSCGASATASSMRLDAQ